MGNPGGLRKALGPGILFAAVSVGASHLVQSTQAGAGWGFTLAIVIVLAMVLKYPLFEFGQRYAAATGQTLLEGYRRLGRWTLVLYLLLTLGTMFTVLAAVALVTGSLAIELTGWEISPLAWSAILVAVSAGILAVGRFPLLDAATKVIMALLTVSTVAAAAVALPRLPMERLCGPVDLGDPKQVLFIVALIGWMPTGLDVCVWQSMWTLARARQTGHAPTVRETVTDYLIGYVATGVLALLFLLLGTAVMFGPGTTFANDAAGFSRQIVRLYTETLGAWSWPLIATAAFTTMFSTLLTVMDGFPRSLQMLLRRFRGPEDAEADLSRAGASRGYFLLMLAMSAGGLAIVAFLMGSFKAFMNLAMTLSFATGPLLGWLAYRAVVADWIPAECRPGPGLRLFAKVGIAFLALFLAYFLVVQFG